MASDREPLQRSKSTGHESTPYLLRDPEPGDMGWVVYRHGVLYAQEFRWDERFEALVAQIIADYMKHHDPARERCWIAERTGEGSEREKIGCVFVVQVSDEIAKLRMLLVEPAARGLGLGRRLVEECIQFARSAGYEKLRLWTNSVLHDARRIYEKTGFKLIEEDKNDAFGEMAQTWELDL
jgi:GNAT superfamily N-acetyltransferase